jgi:hypothetical protein
MSNMLSQIFSISTFFFLLSSVNSLAAQPLKVEPKDEKLLNGESLIYRLEPKARGGQAYKLVYLVRANVDVVWRFKTDFNNEFVLTNKFIEENRFISREDNIVITEAKYLNRPGVKFRWRTTLTPSSYRLDFVLINPEKSKQKFHYGYIQLEAFGQNTKVTHVGYFDFFWAFLWVHYPWSGGMSDFLRYMARWEQEATILLKEKYVGQRAE